MVIDDNTLGGGWIPNPNYNSKTKKLGVAPYIQSQQAPRLEDSVADKFYNSNPSLSYVVRDPNTGKVADTSKYIKEGVTPNRVDNLDDLLADNQTTMSKIWNAGKQAIVSNLLLGTLQGFADIAGGLASLAHYIGSGGGDATNDYNNAASDALEKARQEFDANNPIYVRSDASWYDPSSIISHLPSIAGIASMVIPSTGIVKGTSLAGKALGAGRLLTRARLAMTGAKTAKGIKELDEMGSVARAINSVNGVRTANAAAELTANGIVNAAMWSYSEARGVYNEQYANASDTLTRMQKEDPDAYGRIIQNNQEILNGVDTTNPDEVAKRIAGASADTTFGQDMLVNSIFSTMQYYGLRNVWRGVKNGSTTAALKALDRNRRATAGMTEEEAKKYVENLSFWTNAKNYVGDRMGAFGRLAYSQAVGGAQMAAVSFGHSEGLNYGQVLLNQKPASAFDNRLERYLADPATFEETLWGMLAGTAFHFVGSGIKLGINKLETARKKKAMLNKATTEEERNKINDLFDQQYVDNHARKTALLSTSADFDAYVNTVNKIAHDHKNPYKSDEKGNMTDIKAGSEEETKLLQQAEDEYLTKRIVKSISSGTLNLEKAYMASNEVKDAFVKRGITDAKHADEVQQRILNKMDIAEKAYDTHLNHALTEIGIMNSGRKSEDRIPEVYANQLALDNMQEILLLESLKNDTNALQQDVNSQIAELKNQGKLNAETDYQDYYNTIVTSEQLGHLYAEKARLEATKSKDASTLYSLGIINDRINALEDKVKNTEDASSSTGIGRALWIINRGRSMNYGDGTNNTKKGILYVDLNKFDETSKKYFTETDGELVENGDAIAKELGLKSYKKEDMPAARNRYQYYSDRFGQLSSSTDAIHKLEGELGKDIADKLTIIAYNNNEQVMARHDIAWSRNELAHKFNQYDNIFNEAKVATIQNAIDTILKINSDHFKEGAEAIPMPDYIDRYLKGEKVSNFDGLNDTEQNRFRDAMNILDLTNVDNASIVEWLNNSLQFQTFKEVKAKEQAEKDKDEQEKLNKNRKASQSTQTQQPINGTQDGQQSQGTQGNQPQTETPTAQPTDQASRKAKVYALNTDDFTVAEKSADYNDKGAVRLVDTGDKDDKGNTIYEVTSNNTDRGLDNTILNSDLFNNDGSALADSIPTQNPRVIIDSNGKLVVNTRGQLNANTGETRSDTDTTRQGVVDEGQKTQASSSSTGGEEPTIVREVTEKNGIKITKYGRRKGDKIIYGTGLNIDKDDIPKSELEESGVDKVLDESDGNVTFQLIELRELANKKYAGTVRVNGTINNVGFSHNYVFVFDKNPDKLGNKDSNKQQTNADDTYADDDKITDADRKPDVMSTGEGKDNSGKPKTEKVEATKEVDEETGKPVISQLKHEAIVASRDFVKQLKLTGSTTKTAFRDHVYGVIKANNSTYELTNIDKESIDRTIDTFLNLAKLSGIKIDDKTTAPTDAQKAVVDLGLRSSSVDEDTSNKYAKPEYIKSAKKVIANYAKIVGAENINGKTYIGLEGLLRYCNSVVKDKYAGELLYDSLVNYLSNEGKNEFTTEDIKLSRDELLNNLQKTQEARLEELSKNPINTRINFLDTLQTAKENNDKTTVKAIEHEIDNLNAGDTIELESTHDTATYNDGKSYDRRYIAFKSNNTTLTRLEIPTIHKGGAYSLLVKGWRIDARLYDGKVHSKFAEKLKDIIDKSYNGDKDAVEFTNILIEYRNANADRRKELYDNFQKNKVAKEIIRDYTDKRTKDGKTYNSFTKASLMHLSNIWNYTRTPFLGDVDEYAAKIQEESIRDIRKGSIDTWATKLFNNWQSMNDMFNHSKDYKVTVTKISDGEIILNNAEKDATYEEMSPILKDKKHKENAIADNKLTKDENGLYKDIRIGVGIGMNQTEISGVGVINTNGINRYSTSLMIKNRDGRWEAVHAYGTRAKDFADGDKGKEIVDAFNTQVKTILEKFYANNADSVGAELRALFDSAYYARFSSLFDGLYIHDEQDGNGFTITKKTTDSNEQGKKTIAFKFTDKYGFADRRPYVEIREVGKPNKIFVFDKSGLLGYAERTEVVNGKLRYGEVKLGTKAADKFYDALNKFIIDNTNFKIANGYIEADGNGGASLKGLAKHDNGKFVVELGGKRFESESYNNFLIDNNLIRVNTHVENGSNYKRVGERSLSGNQVLEVGLEHRPPVEEEGKPDTSTTEPTKRTAADVKSTLPNVDDVEELKGKVKKLAKEKNPKPYNGRAIASAILGDEFVKPIKSIEGKYSLFPKTVVFSDKFNNIAGENINAITNVSGETKTLSNKKGTKSIGIPKHTTVIGTKFLSLLDNKEDRARAVRVLMHEQIHQILYKDGNQKYIGSIKDIYNEFETEINSRHDNKVITDEQYDKLAKFLFKNLELSEKASTDDNANVRYEEFLIESLTNKELVDALNDITVTDAANDSKKVSLFEKILRVISDIFGWDIKENSLRAKEIKEFSKVLSEIEKPKEEDIAKDKDENKDKDNDNNKVPVDEKKDLKPEVTPEPKEPLDDDGSVDVSDIFMDNSILGDFKASSVGEYNLDNRGVPVRNETVTDFGRYNKLSAEQKTAYERLREAGVLSITCHV